MLIMIGLIANLLNLIVKLPFKTALVGKRPRGASDCTRQSGLLIVASLLLLLLLLRYLDDCFSGET